MNNGGTRELEYVSSLTDDDLYQKLRDLGDTVGPIVGTTRSLYERRLYNLLNGVMMGLNQREQEVIIEPPSEPKRTTRMAVVDNDRNTENETTNLRQRNTHQSSNLKPRTTQTTTSSSEGEAEDEVVEVKGMRILSSYNYPEYESPKSSSFVVTPRRGFYTDETLNSSPSTSSPYMSMLSSGSLVNNHRSGTVLNNNFNQKSSSKTGESCDKKSLKKTHPMVTTLFEIFIVCFLLVVGYIFYQEIIMYSKAEKEFVESNGQNFPNQ